MNFGSGYRELIEPISWKLRTHKSQFRGNSRKLAGVRIRVKGDSSRVNRRPPPPATGPCPCLYTTRACSCSPFLSFSLCLLLNRIWRVPSTRSCSAQSRVGSNEFAKMGNTRSAAALLGEIENMICAAFAQCGKSRAWHLHHWRTASVNAVGSS